MENPGFVALNIKIPQVLEIIAKNPHPCSELDPNTLEKWRKMKTERNSLLALIAAKSMDQSYASRSLRPPYGLIRENYRNGHLEQVVSLEVSKTGNNEEDFVNRMVGLQFDLGFTLKHDLKETISRMRSSPPGGQDRGIYERIKMLTTGFWQSGERNTRAGDSVFLFSARAIDSALNVASRLSFTARHLYINRFGIEPTMAELGAIIGDSQNAFVYLAGMHLSTFNQVIRAITPENERVRSFLSYYFLLETDSKGLVIKVNTGSIEELINSSNIELNSDTTYCPALASASLTHRQLGLEKPGYKTPIHGFVDWYAKLLQAA